MPHGNSSESHGNLSVFVEHVNKEHFREQVSQSVSRRRPLYSSIASNSFQSNGMQPSRNKNTFNHIILFYVLGGGVEG